MKLNPMESIRQWLQPKNAVTTGLSLEELIRLSGGLETASGIPVGVGPAEGLAAMAASVRVLSNVVCHLPLILFETDGETREPAKAERLYKLLKSTPNDWQTSWQWRKLGMRDLLYRGNWYNYKVPGLSGIPQELIRLHPDRVTKKQDANSLIITYEVSTNAGTITYSAEEVMHIWFDSDDGVHGIDPIKAHRNSIGDGIAVRDHGSKFFRNATRLSGLLELEKGTSMLDDARNDLLKDFDSNYTGSENAHRTGMLPAGVSFKPVSISMENSQWIEARHATARDIFGIMGVPAHKGGDLADATYANVEHENLGFVIDSIVPIVVGLEQSFNKDLLHDVSNFFVKFNVAGLLRGDFKSRQEGLNIQRRAGIINADEWRALEDMNPRGDEGGQEYIIEQNMKENDGKGEPEPKDVRRKAKLRGV